MSLETSLSGFLSNAMKNFVCSILVGAFGGVIVDLSGASGWAGAMIVAVFFPTFTILEFLDLAGSVKTRV